MSLSHAVSRRERARAATIDEIKQTALELMRSSGSLDVRFVDIARQMGMTAPALYRYFADRDALLTELIVDSFDDLGATVGAAGAGVPPSDPAGRWAASCAAYRSWALTQPERFALLFGLPVPGYVAPQDGATKAAAHRAMGQLESLAIAAIEHRLVGSPLVASVDGALARALLEKQSCGIDPPPEVLIEPERYQAMLHIWSMLHGFVSLEANGHFQWLDEPERNALFEAQQELAMAAVGIQQRP